jgi:hypothetical protein
MKVKIQTQSLDLSSAGTYLPVRQYKPCTVARLPACSVKYPQGERSVFHAGVCSSADRAKKILDTLSHSVMSNKITHNGA